MGVLATANAIETQLHPMQRRDAVRSPYGDMVTHQTSGQLVFLRGRRSQFVTVHAAPCREEVAWDRELPASDDTTGFVFRRRSPTGIATEFVHETVQHGVSGSLRKNASSEHHAARVQSMRRHVCGYEPGGCFDVVVDEDHQVAGRVTKTAIPGCRGPRVRLSNHADANA